MEEGPHREGAPDGHIDDALQAATGFGWKPCLADIDEIMRTAWKWKRRLQNSKGNMAGKWRTRRRVRPEAGVFFMIVSGVEKTGFWLALADLTPRFPVVMPLQVIPYFISK